MTAAVRGVERRDGRTIGTEVVIFWDMDLDRVDSDGRERVFGECIGAKSHSTRLGLTRHCLVAIAVVLAVEWILADSYPTLQSIDRCPQLDALGTFSLAPRSIALCHIRCRE